MVSHSKSRKRKQAGYDIAVVGGAGHVGTPLSLVLAKRGLRTLIYDLNRQAMDTLAGGRLPFLEEGGEPILKEVLASGMLGFSAEVSSLRGIPVIVLTIGTPIDEFHNPNFSVLTRCVDSLLPHLLPDQTIILRSTVSPGATEFLDRYLRARGSKVGLAFCPERVVQGNGIHEIQVFPQLISATSPRALKIAREVFARVAPEVIVMTPAEAEFAKLICNAFRYITFAATNQLYMMVESAGLNYNALLAKMKRGYSRMAALPGPGFAAGPCLMKDTMQLFAFQKHNFVLGQVAMIINEGLPSYLVQRLAAKFDLRKTAVGILGMAFKAESDDIRDSLSYKLGKLLRYHGASVFYTDEYVNDPTFVDKETLIRKSDVIIVGVPHKAYRSLRVPASKHVLDLWSALPARKRGAIA